VSLSRHRLALSRLSTSVRKLRAGVGGRSESAIAPDAGAPPGPSGPVGVPGLGGLAGAAAHLHGHLADEDPTCPYCQLVHARHWREPA
jgi:hypothetical protein